MNSFFIFKFARKKRIPFSFFVFKSEVRKTVHVAVLDVSPFWRVAVLDTTKTATRLNSDNPTYPKRPVDLYPKRCGVVAVLDLAPF